ARFVLIRTPPLATAREAPVRGCATPPRNLWFTFRNGPTVVEKGQAGDQGPWRHLGSRRLPHHRRILATAYIPLKVKKAVSRQLSAVSQNTRTAGASG